MLTQLAAIANSDTTHLFVALGDFRMRVPGPEKFHSDTATQTPPCGVSLSLASDALCAPFAIIKLNFACKLFLGGRRSKKLSSFMTRKLAYSKFCLASQLRLGTRFVV